MRKFLFLLCVLGASRPSWAQSNPASWENLKTLQPGEKVQVVQVNSNKVSGTFSNVSDAAISVQSGSGPQTIQKLDVRSVKLMVNKHRLRNTLIGAGVGAGAGAGITAAAWEPGGFAGGKGTGAAVGAVIGGVSGAVVGALLPSHETVYNVR